MKSTLTSIFWRKTKNFSSETTNLVSKLAISKNKSTKYTWNLTKVQNKTKNYRISFRKSKDKSKKSESYATDCNKIVSFTDGNTSIMRIKQTQTSITLFKTSLTEKAKMWFIHTLIIILTLEVQ